MCRAVSTTRAAICTPPATLAVGAMSTVSAEAGTPARSATKSAIAGGGWLARLQAQHRPAGMLVPVELVVELLGADRARAPARCPSRSSRRGRSASPRTARPGTRSRAGRCVTVTPGSQRPSRTSGAYATAPSPPMQISANRRPASKPPAACAPQSITRVPFGSVVTSMRAASASAANRSASSTARSLSESVTPPPPRHRRSGSRPRLSSRPSPDQRAQRPSAAHRRPGGRGDAGGEAATPARAAAAVPRTRSRAAAAHG